MQFRSVHEKWRFPGKKNKEPDVKRERLPQKKTETASVSFHREKKWLRFVSGRSRRSVLSQINKKYPWGNSWLMEMTWQDFFHHSLLSFYWKEKLTKARENFRIGRQVVTDESISMESTWLTIRIRLGSEVVECAAGQRKSEIKEIKQSR